MNDSDRLVYRVAIEDDCESLTTLVNSSYFGELSNQGWTNENGMVTGQRTNTENISNMIADGTGVFLVFFGEIDHILKGCIRLTHDLESTTAFLGMFAVRPDLQARGYGKFILSVAENYVVSNWKVDYIKLRVVLQRPELIAYYIRRGYTDTGFREPFPIQLLNSIKLLRSDLEIITMSKDMKKNE